ncbi:TetR/AcrR family transcriptional regulator [Minwuia sp.]|uniref:TetR/AcrR family transcriptional regulator n=1 Tax=Minwuia sp. TaxID=2493630 RepID=UPI003A8D9C63
MTVSAEYRARNRTAVLRAAARLFRRHGYDGVNVDRIMAEAGLTRGTFYTYFKSKKHLFRAAIGFEPDFERRLSERPGKDLNAEAAAIAADYLNPDHRDRTWPGCAMASLSQDAARADAGTRSAFADIVRNLIIEFERGLENPQHPDPRALQAVAMAVGGLVLAKASDGTDLADQVSDAAAAGVRQILTG